MSDLLEDDNVKDNNGENLSSQLDTNKNNSSNKFSNEYDLDELLAEFDSKKQKSTDENSNQKVKDYEDIKHIKINSASINKIFRKILLILSIAIFIIGVSLIFVYIGRYYCMVKTQNQIMMDELNKDTFYEGTRIMGLDVGGKTIEQAKEELEEIQKVSRPSMNIVVKSDYNTVELTEDDFMFSYNTDKILLQAYNIARNGLLKDRYNQLLKLKEEPIDFAVEATLQKDEIEKAADKVENEIYCSYKDAQIVSFSPTIDIAEGENGRKLDREDFEQKIHNFLDCGNMSGEIQVNTNKIPFKITKNDLINTYSIISTYSTVSKNTVNANTNMSIALRSINTKCLEPGDVFSFNECTGNTNLASLGYLPADAIENGKIIQQNGGGVCQAATTVYAAAIRANMTIIERHNHEWPSSYIPIGLDAAISYPYADLKFRNDSDYPIYIHTFMNSNTLTCEFYGKKPTEYDSISTTSWITQTTEEYTTAKAQKIFYKDGAEIKKEDLFSSYYKNKK